MNLMVRSFAVMLGLSLGIQTLPAFAAEDATTRLRKAAEAALKVQQASYTAQFESVNAEGTVVRETTAEVTIARHTKEALMAGRLLLIGRTTTPGQARAEAFHAAYDGEHVRKLDATKRVLLEATASDGGETLLPSMASQLVLTPLLVAEPFAEEIAAGPRLEADAEVGATSCRVVLVPGKAEDETTRLFFDDALMLRRIERRFLSASGRPVSTRLTISELKTSESQATHEMFVLKTPADYTEQKFSLMPLPAITIGMKAVNWSLRDPAGTVHTQKQYEGKVIVMEFWSSTCQFCAAALPKMKEFWGSYKDRGVMVLGMNCREDTTGDPVTYARDNAIPFPVLIDANAVATRYRVQGIPSFLVFGADGTLIHKVEGYNSILFEELVQVVEKHLQERNM